MQKLHIATDGKTPLYAPNKAGNGDIYVCHLAADTATSLTVPSGARIAIFGLSTAADYWLGFATFSIPTSGTFEAANLYLNPPPMDVTGITTLWFRSLTETGISVAFYS